MKFDYALFDLDGTLSESGPGITKSVQYALHCLGIEEPDLDNLRSFIGPPLNIEFKRVYGLSSEQVVFAVEKYRERYGTTGMFECEMYPGIPRMLEKCSRQGIVLAVASSKPEPYVISILDHFGITNSFDVIVGSSPDEEMNRAGADQKQFIVRKALDMLRQAGPGTDRDGDFEDRCAMVGDRCYDMDGARANHVHAVGAAFGYGSVQELKDAGAEYIAGTVTELTQILCGEA